MDREEMIARIAEIGTCADDVERRTMLADFQNEVTALCDRADELSAANQNLTDSNEKLRAANMQLFVQVGTNKKPEDVAQNDPAPEKRKFENLFNDKGEIK